MDLDRRIDVMLEKIEAAIDRQDFDYLAARLKLVNVAAEREAILVAWLMFTVRVASKIQGREEFYKRVHARLVSEGEDADEALRGLGAEGEANASSAHAVLYGFLDAPVTLHTNGWRPLFRPL